MENPDQDFRANVFGVDNFPVCSADQKVELEKAFNEAVSKGRGQTSGHCICDLIIALLTGTATETDRYAAARMVAQSIYQEKMGWLAAMEALVAKGGGPVAN